MGITVDVDTNSGFCAGVIRAISKAEDFLDLPMDQSADRNDRGQGKKLFSLGAIVHNDSELARLERKGLVTIDKDDLNYMKSVDGEYLLIRAHGEPPKTYRQAEAIGFRIVDCTCPVVLQLQKNIRTAYERFSSEGTDGQIIIFGKIGHAEVLGLLGQVDDNAIVIEDMKMMLGYIEDGTISLFKKTEVFSQTTKSPAEYSSICSRLEEMMSRANELSLERFKGKAILSIHNTICSQVASRHEKLSKFALAHDVIIFVLGKASSNGKILCDLCKSLNIRTYHIGSSDEIKKEWFREDDKVGVCGATSTPKWLLEEVASKIRENNL